MPKTKEDKKREYRIEMEIVVDAHDEEERAMGWYYYLEDEITFPFNAKCDKECPTSPISKGDIVEVIEMQPGDEYNHEMLVNIKFQNKKLAIPLSQLQPLKVNKKTQQAIEDWHYWVNMGYQF